MKIRESHSQKSNFKVYIYENKKEEYFVISIPDLFWSIKVDYDLYGESLIEHLYLHLFNVLDEDESEELANRISQWTSEL
ncbi:YueH family protein [Mammaliicoccus stepanovicii]|uniref:YueH-like protein n=1 Tax=Mammaliicoccus stepanovicii TaxID=643214 RepID=A0A239ZRT1_9STAP|nr:YueH family protein [Mammaliicoccus stepanovicii]PNZ74332.1 hypothetical protein CD111_08900 [Mammaliicoccus stepanovicii]GGI38785.1 hypothetical protein GCM10010896_00120 [Mammaliicoccus stepanovicii]SNV73805.1 Uncharacterised protein [Mammaliicoccus stepanovicii]